MQIVLLQDVEKVGLRGEVVDVARGYARNYLLPRKLAQPSTPTRIAELEKVQAHRARHEAQTFEQARELADSLGQTTLRLEVKAGPPPDLPLRRSDEVQGNILAGFNKHHQVFLFLQFADRASGRAKRLCRSIISTCRRCGCSVRRSRSWARFMARQWAVASASRWCRMSV